MTGIGRERARSMSALVRLTTACISGLNNDALMKSFCMSCNTKAVLDRPIGGNGAPLITTPFSVYAKRTRQKSEIPTSKSATIPKRVNSKFEARNPKPRDRSSPQRHRVRRVQNISQRENCFLCALRVTAGECPLFFFMFEIVSDFGFLD